MKALIKDSIINFHTGGMKKTYPRKTKLPLNSKNIISVVGVRRTGKTFLLYETIKDLLALNIPINRIVYLNFEDERLNLQTSELDLILQAYMELYPNYPLEDCYFFFDEIQNISGWEKFIRRIFDTVSTNIFITGSNSNLLSWEVATELRGRTLSYVIYPLNFREFLYFNNIPPDVYGTNQKIKLLDKLNEFLLFGGFPELIHLEKTLKNRKLQDYFNSIIYKDLIERYNISNPSVLKFFIKRILLQVTKPFSINKLHNDLKSMGYKIGNNLLYEYADYIQASYMSVLIQKFDYSELKREKSEKKAYAVDNGFLTSMDYSFSENFGKLFENMIAMELIKSEQEIYFFKMNNECDFIIKKKETFIPIQVSYSMKDPETKQREIKGLLSACQFFGLKSGIIVSYEEDYSENHKDIDILVVPAYKFLLEYL